MSISTNGRALPCWLACLAFAMTLGGAACGGRTAMFTADVGGARGDAGPGDAWLDGPSLGGAAGSNRSGGVSTGSSSRSGGAVGGSVTIAGRSSSSSSMMGGATGQGGSTVHGGASGTSSQAGGQKGGAGSGGAATSGQSSSGAKPLWRNSTRPFSQELKQASVSGVWSDDRGVFVLGKDGSSSRPTIWTNPGDGWRTRYVWPEGSSVGDGLRGFDNQALVAFGGRPCSIQLIDNQERRCSGGSREMYDLFIVQADLAYTSYYVRVLRYDGNLWTQFGNPLPEPTPGLGNAKALWADATLVVVAMTSYPEGQVFLISPEGQVLQQSGLATPELSAVWGFGGKDIWVGSRAGKLFHYDGATWSLHTSFSGEGSGIVRLWGQNGELFVITERELVHWNGTRMSTIDALTTPGAYKDIWGNSAKEVFVTCCACESDSPTCTCVPQVRWFDGSRVGEL